MNNFKTIGRVSAKLLAELLEKQKEVFVIKDAEEILEKTNMEARDLLRRMANRGLIARLKAGKFLIIPQGVTKTIGNWYVAGSEIVNTDDYYIGFYSAMQYWGMTTQPVIKIYIATIRRQIVPKEMKNRVVFVLIKKSRYWGVNNEWVTNHKKAKISDIERTIIDGLAHPGYCGGITEVAKGMWIVKDKIDYGKLKDYAAGYNKNVVCKRLGYILEILKAGDEGLIEYLRTYVKGRYDKFDPANKGKRTEKNRWKLIDNVGRKQIEGVIWS
ncbi:MAG TPA: hypothetical protein ENN43_08815 [bacterium]|nr:hypothetical protein [bacterium]